MLYSKKNNKIRIITSVNHDITEQELSNYSNMGIDEFYFGFMPGYWIARYGWEVCTNRRPYPVLPHITSFENALRLIKIAHGYEKKIYLAVNEHFYSKEQYNLLMSMIKDFAKAGIDGIMVADPALITYLRYNKIKLVIHGSVGLGVYNTETVNFFNKLGIKRFILPRQLHLQEIKHIIDMTPRYCQFEIFLAGEWCRYDDSYCFATHGYNRDELCKLHLKGRPNFHKKHLLLNEKVSFGWCGICILQELKNYYDRIIFKIPVRSDIFKQSSLLKKIIQVLKKENLSFKTIRQLLDCHSYFCVYGTG